MAKGVAESDWKVFREIHSVALERFSKGILDELLGHIADNSQSAHERYLKVFATIQNRNKDIKNAFDDFRRSTMFLQLGIMYSYGLVTENELARFSAETQHSIRSLYSIRRCNDFVNASPDRGNIYQYKLRVLSVSPERLIVRHAHPESEAVPEEWVFPASRIPEEWLDWEVGKEFDLKISEAELDRLLGKGNTDD